MYLHPLSPPLVQEPTAAVMESAKQSVQYADDKISENQEENVRFSNSEANLGLNELFRQLDNVLRARSWHHVVRQYQRLPCVYTHTSNPREK